MLCPWASICLHGLLADLDQSWDQNGTEVLQQAEGSLWCHYVCQAPSGHKSASSGLEKELSANTLSIKESYLVWLIYSLYYLYASLHGLGWTKKNLFTPRPAGSKHWNASKCFTLLIAGLLARAQPLLATGVAGKSLVWHLNTALSTC